MVGDVTFVGIIIDESTVLLVVTTRCGLSGVTITVVWLLETRCWLELIFSKLAASLNVRVSALLILLEIEGNTPSDTGIDSVKVTFFDPASSDKSETVTDSGNVLFIVDAVDDVSDAVIDSDKIVFCDVSVEETNIGSGDCITQYGAK